MENVCVVSLLNVTDWLLPGIVLHSALPGLCPSTLKVMVPVYGPERVTVTVKDGLVLGHRALIETMLTIGLGPAGATPGPRVGVLVAVGLGLRPAGATPGSGMGVLVAAELGVVFVAVGAFVGGVACRGIWGTG